jgi:regulator of cell morphogenesis and NO signaling
MNTKYKPADKMIDLISEDYHLLQVISRFGLSLGFGDQTVEEVCTANHVDCPTFLTVINFITEGYSRMYDGEDALSIPTLLDYLRQSHLYFLDFYLPGIRKKLVSAIEQSTDDVSFLIIRFFDEYMKEVRRHMDYEDKTVFNYVESLLGGKLKKNYQISTFSKHHDSISIKMTELKNIIIRYCPAKVNANLLNMALFDIYTCEAELDSHCNVEDYLFVPAVLKLEQKVLNNENE